VQLGGDVITAIDGTPVASAEDVSRIVAEQLLPGQTVPFTILRGGTKKAVVRVRLTERPAESP
jgi:S1-C subfamily serine protease